MLLTAEPRSRWSYVSHALAVHVRNHPVTVVRRHFVRGEQVLGSLLHRGMMQIIFTLRDVVKLFALHRAED